MMTISIPILWKIWEGKRCFFWIAKRDGIVTMLERFYKLKKEIKMAMVQLDVPFDLSEKEMKEINEMCETLAPFKAAVDALASKDADMLLSEKIIAFVLKKLGKLQSNISNDLIERLSIRIDELGFPLYNPEKSQDYVMEIPEKSQAQDFSFSPKIPSLLQT